MKPIETNLHLIMKRYKVRILALFSLAISLAVASANSTPYSRLFAFGDSLTDTGNFYALSGGSPPAPYFEGRFSNGRLWIEYFAEGLRMNIRPEDNYAVAGSTTGYDNSNDGLGGLTYPGMQDQIDAFRANHNATEVSDALFIVWAGANDFFIALQTGAPPQTLISNGVFNTAMAIQKLHQGGARHILVVNLPDLGVTPFARNAGMSVPITQLSTAYNQALAGTLDALDTAGISTIRVDSFTTLQDMATNPSEYAFDNATQPFLSTGGDPDRFLFWDQVHVTTRGHEVLASEALDRLVGYYLARQKGKTPSSRVNALHGLVHARPGS